MKISNKQVRAWFDTVLNPLIQNLESEKSSLDYGDLKWRGFNQALFSFKLTKQMIEYQFLPNLEHCLASNPNLESTLNEHNNTLRELAISCLKLYNELVNSIELRSIYFQCLNDFLSGKEINSLDKQEFEEDENINYIADYIINNEAVLGNEYMLSPIWNPNIEKFRSILELEKIKPLYDEFKVAFLCFSDNVSKSIQVIKDLRFQLAEEFGEPFVASPNQYYQYELEA